MPSALTLGRPASTEYVPQSLFARDAGRINGFSYAPVISFNAMMNLCLQGSFDT